MKLSRIEIDAFGCLSGFFEEVAPALHVFYGPNESGKSTLQHAILALLYGFYEGDRARATENAARQRFVPWQGTRYAARLEYELQDGCRYRVTRNFADDDNPTMLSDALTGREVTDQFGRGRHGNVPFMRRQLGMTRGVFESCAFVRQGELLQVTGEGRVTPQEMGDAIISLADSARRDVSAQKAIERLSEAFKKQVGGPAARATPLPVARGRLVAGRRELEEIDAIRREVATDAEHLERGKEEARRLTDSIARNRYLLARAELSEVQGRLGRLARLEEQSKHFEQRLASAAEFADFPAEERDELVRIWNSVRELRDRLVKEQTEAERQRRRLEELHERREALARRTSELAHLRQYPADREPDINALAQHWRQSETIFREAESRAAAAAEAAAPLRDEYAALASEVGTFSAADLQVLTGNLRAPAPRGTILGAIAGAALKLALCMGRGVRWLARTLLRRGKGPSRPPSGVDKPSPLDSVSQAEAGRLLQAHVRFLEIAPVVQRDQVERAARERALENRETAASRLRLALSGLVEEMGDLEAACSQFAARAASRRQLDAFASQLEDVERESESLRETVDRFRADGERLRRQEADLRERLSTIVRREGKLEELFEAFESACRQHRLHEDAARSLREIENTRGVILEGRSPAELSEMIARREAELASLTMDNPSLEGARSNAGAEALKESLSRESRQLRELELRIEALATRIQTRLSGLRSRAEVEEEIEQHSKEVAALEEFGRSLTIARELVEQAMTEAHRNFAPSVGRFLSDGLARVTNGRYQKAMLDPATFRVTTEVPETRDLVDVEKLSQGTQAAAYLLLRVGLAQHMSSLSEPVPVLLDDPLVDLDDVRVEAVLDLLLERSREVQVLLFTKDEGTRRWFERNCASDASCRITRLQPLSAASPVAASALKAGGGAPAPEQAHLGLNGDSSHS